MGEYSSKNIEKQRTEIQKRDRKRPEYLNLNQKPFDSYNTLFASRLFNYMGYPTFNAYPNRDINEILIEKLVEDDPFHFDLPPKPTSIEEINLIKRQFEEAKRSYIIERFYRDETMARQFIRRNMVANFFTDKDVNVGNVVCNDETKEIKHIDIAFLPPITIFPLGNILEGSGYCSNLDVFNVMDDDAYNVEYFENRKLEDLGKYVGVKFIVDTTKEEYFSLIRKVF